MDAGGWRGFLFGVLCFALFAGVVVALAIAGIALYDWSPWALFGVIAALIWVPLAAIFVASFIETVEEDGLSTALLQYAWATILVWLPLLLWWLA